MLTIAGLCKCIFNISAPLPLLSIYGSQLTSEGYTSVTMDTRQWLTLPFGFENGCVHYFTLIKAWCCESSDCDAVFNYCCCSISLTLQQLFSGNVFCLFVCVALYLFPSCHTSEVIVAIVTLLKDPLKAVLIHKTHLSLWDCIIMNLLILKVY